MLMKKGFHIILLASLGFWGCDSADHRSGSGAGTAAQKSGSIGQGSDLEYDSKTKGSNSSKSNGKNGNGDGGEDTADIPSGPFDPDADLGAAVEDIPSGMMLRNFRGIESTLLSVSGFTTWPAPTATVLASVNSLLPRGFSPAEFGGTVQQAVIKLAHSLAEQIVADATIRARFFGTTDLTGAAATVYSTAGRSTIFKSILSEVGRGTVIDQAEQEKAMNELVTGLLADNISTTDISIALLVQVMSSTDVLFEQ